MVRLHLTAQKGNSNDQKTAKVLEICYSVYYIVLSVFTFIFGELEMSLLETAFWGFLLLGSVSILMYEFVRRYK